MARSRKTKHRNRAKLAVPPPPPQSQLTSRPHKQTNGSEKKQDYDYTEFEYQQARPVIEESLEAEQQHIDTYALQSVHVSPKKPGYSAGSGLRSIAQGSADQASSAVSNQHAAAKQAAYVAQNTLAQAASQAAATAQVNKKEILNHTVWINMINVFSPEIGRPCRQTRTATRSGATEHRGTTSAGR